MDSNGTGTAPHEVLPVEDKSRRRLDHPGSVPIDCRLPKLNVACSIPVSRSIESTIYGEDTKFFSILVPFLFAPTPTH